MSVRNASEGRVDDLDHRAHLDDRAHLDNGDHLDDGADLDAAPTSTAARTRRGRRDVGERRREGRSPAAQRAIDRSRKRSAQRSTARLVHEDGGQAAAVLRLVRSPGNLLRRMPFAGLVIGILACGLMSTLWLSTTAAQDSYGLSAARERQQSLTDRRDALKKQFESGNAAPQVAQNAQRLGMIPATDVAHLVVGRDGKVHVEGDITAASGKPAPALNDDSSAVLTPQPGSSRSGNTAQLPVEAVPGVGSQQPLSSNVLPQNGSGENATSTARGAEGGSSQNGANAPGATAQTRTDSSTSTAPQSPSTGPQASSAPPASSGSVAPDSSVPR